MAREAICKISLRGMLEWADQSYNAELIFRQCDYADEISRLNIGDKRVQGISHLQYKIRKHLLYSVEGDQIIMRALKIASFAGASYNGYRN